MFEDAAGTSGVLRQLPDLLLRYFSVMTKIQGQFATRAEAEKARLLLAQAGVAEEHMRIWNVIPAGESTSAGAKGAATGAVIGGLVSGVGGVVSGGIIGAALDEANDAGNRLPEPSGVRLVVDTDAGSPDVAALLRSAGATNVG